MKYIQQLDETDCGAACIAMIASHYNTNKTVTYIRSIAGTDTKGTNLAGLIQGATKLGFNAYALKGTQEALSSNLPFPFIAHLKINRNEQSILHYVIVKSIVKNQIEIWDPDETKRKYKISIEDFCKMWSGYAVFISPNKKIKIERDRKPFLLSFLPIIKSYKKQLFYACISSFVLLFFNILFTLYTRYIIDEVLILKTRNALTSLSIGIIIVIVFQSIIDILRKKLLIYFSFKIDLKLVFSYFAHVFHLPMSFFSSRKTGEIISRLQDIRKIQELLSQSTVSAIMDSFMILIIGPILYTINKKLFLIVLITIPFSSVAIYWFSKIYKKQYHKLMSEASDVQSCLVECIDGIATLKSLNAEDYAFNNFEHRQMSMAKTEWKAIHIQSYQEFFSQLINRISNIIIFWMGSYCIIEGDFTIGSLISFTTLSTYFIEPALRLINLQSKIQESLIATERLGEILELETEQNCKQHLLFPKRLKGNIEINDVSFRYGTRNYVYEHLNLSIPAGKKVAIIGASGCGKTTIVKLLLRLYEPETGSIYIGEKNIKDIDINCLRKHIGYVPQEISLFSGTVAENIALHNPTASLEEIVFAAKEAGADTFIEKLPERYNSMLGEKGINLSGGERQRIAIARAILDKPDILIFDEATSNLDTLSEQYIKQTLDKLHNSELTIIIIAHRLSTIIDCDSILVMDNGDVIQKGTHIDLLKQDGLYKELIRNMKI